MDSNACGIVGRFSGQGNKPELLALPSSVTVGSDVTSGEDMFMTTQGP